MCIDSWKKFFPDYEFKFWNETNAPIDKGYAKEAYDAKRYAFVADYVRTWALYTYGGIYMDTDMLVIKDFPLLLLNTDCFFAYEQKERLYVNVAVWGACKNSSFVQTVLDIYDRSSFDISRIFDFAIPNIVTGVLKSENIQENVLVLDYDVFYPFPQKKRRTTTYMKYVTENTLAIHLWDFTWLTFHERVKEHIKMIFNGLLRK